MNHALVSVRPRFAQMLLDGTKTVELRRRRLSLPDETMLWLYCTLPVGDVVGAAYVARVNHGSPASVWHQFSSRTGLTASEFRAYTREARWVTAIELQKVVRLPRSVSLQELRVVRSRFQPPQSIASVNQEAQLLAFLQASLEGVRGPHHTRILRCDLSWGVTRGSSRK